VPQSWSGRFEEEKLKRKFPSAGNRNKGLGLCLPVRNPVTVRTSVSLADAAMISKFGVAHINPLTPNDL
jgi:hypothetical protein